MWFFPRVQIYRLFIIYDSNYALIVIPCLAWCAAFGTSHPYPPFTIVLNIVITTLICLRLFYFSRRIKHILGPDGAKTYTGIAAILIESAAPYSLVGLMFLIPYARQSETAIGFGQVWAKMTVRVHLFLNLGKGYHFPCLAAEC